MQVNLITPNFYTRHKNDQNSHYSNTVMPSKLSPLKADTVTFGNGIANSSFKLEEVIRLGYDKKIPLYQSMGVRLMDTLKVISDKFSSRGVSFDEEYCAPAIVKSTDSFISKLLRSGESLDRVRTSLFVENPYDFKLIRDILNELELRNYFVRPISQKINGRKVTVPDFDIRLGGVVPEDTKVLGGELAKCIGKPQKSGYEDIQMRLVDTTLNSKKDVTPLELIILYGKNYAIAKHNESYYSYDIRRMLDELLHISKIENPKVNTPAYRVINNTGIIGDILSNNIAKPLFFNAKNKDYFHETLQMPVELSKGNCEVLTGLLNGISAKISQHYRAEAARVKSEDFKPELERLVKGSNEYLNREDKTVYIADLRKMKRVLLDKIKNDKTEDFEVLNQVKARLAETIEKYGLDI